MRVSEEFIEWGLALLCGVQACSSSRLTRLASPSPHQLEASSFQRPPNRMS